LTTGHALTALNNPFVQIHLACNPDAIGTGFRQHHSVEMGNLDGQFKVVKSR